MSAPAPAAPAAPAAGPWLSVLVPVYNVAPYLRQCVESVLQQADAGVEILLLDDVSTDASAAVMQALQRVAGSRLRLLAHERNRGLSAARNTLLEAASGTHVWFVDSDDWLAPGVLPKLSAILQAQPVPDMVFFDYRVVRARDWLQYRLKYRLRGEHHRASLVGAAHCRLRGGPALLEAVLASGNLFSWAHVSRRALWQAAPPLRFPEGRSFEDITTTPRLTARADSAWHVPEAWVMYRRRDDSISALMSAAKVADLCAAMRGQRDELLARFPQLPPSTRVALAHQAARNLMAALRHLRPLPPEQAAALMPRCGEEFLAAVGEDLPLLRRAYLRRGWWWRAWRLAQALRVTKVA